MRVANRKDLSVITLNGRMEARGEVVVVVVEPHRRRLLGTTEIASR